ncbi:hypothetical protein JHK84_052371 [Glycine max]|nr:hypothetical protein JHK85_053185 [Glycine max]KAG5082333.1 hypothetical protein JHK84_052371 [Glycine max]
MPDEKLKASEMDGGSFLLADFFFFFVEEVAAIVAVIRRLSWCIEEASAKSNATVHVEGAS